MIQVPQYFADAVLSAASLPLKLAATALQTIESRATHVEVRASYRVFNDENRFHEELRRAQAETDDREPE